jgi:hypothetical protein
MLLPPTRTYAESAPRWGRPLTRFGNGVRHTSGKRARIKLTGLQAYIDDSGSERRDPFFVLGGFVTQAEDWAAFSNEWDVLLKTPPVLGYFKMSEANSLTGEFNPSRGWDEKLRDIRVNALCEVACNHTRLATHVYLKNEDFDKYIASLLLPYRQLSSDSPYPLMVMQLVFLLANFQAMVAKESEEIGIFLDTQLGFEAELTAWWDLFLDYEDFDGLPLADFVRAPPTFRNSKEFPPLQAADMFAWHRRYFYANGVKTPILARLEDRPTLRCPIGEKPLKAIGEILKRQVKAFQIIMPDAPLLSAGKKGRRLTKKLKAQRAMVDPSRT